MVLSGALCFRTSKGGGAFSVVVEPVTARFIGNRLEHFDVSFRHARLYCKRLASAIFTNSGQIDIMTDL